MIDLTLIGIGTGDPDHITVAAVKALNRADLVLIPQKPMAPDLSDLRMAICAAHLTNPAVRLVPFAMPVRDAAAPIYGDGVAAWHDAVADEWRAAIAAHPGSRSVAVMVWGDPSLYDSSLRIAQRLGARGLAVAVSVVPGITSLQMLAARHAITLNTVGGAFVVTTGRNLVAQGFPPGIDTAVVMLDGDTAFMTLPGDAYHIHWGAYLGMPAGGPGPGELLDAGILAEAGPRIVARRAAARDQHGWIMDTYLLRRLG